MGRTGAGDHMTTLPPQVQAALDEIEAMENPPPAPEPVVVLEEPPAPEPAPEPTPPAEDWRAKYQTLQGMYNAEVPRLQDQLRDLQEEVKALRKAPEPEPVKVPKVKKVTEKDVETFGEDLIDLIRRQAEEQVDGDRDEIAALKKTIEALQTQVGGVQEQTADNARQTYFIELAKLVPDYEAINADEKFLDWCRETDDLSGQLRQTYLSSAFNGLDVLRTAKFLNAWKATKAPLPAPAPRSDLEKQVAPGTSRATTTTPTTTTDRVWSGDEVSNFYRDVSKGAYVGRAADMARIEAEIDLAAATGRIRA